MKISLEDVKRVATELVGEFGKDYKYVNPNGETPVMDQQGFCRVPCYNWDEQKNKPSCVVGHILFRLGVPKQRLIDFNDDTVETFTGDYLDDDAIAFLGCMQSRQDKGYSWGDALARASEGRW